MRLHFLDNTDPDGYYMLFRKLHHELDRTLCVVVSKSGETMETINAMKETKAAFARLGLDFAKQAVAITGPGSSLETRAKEEKWLGCFPIWEWVGGRTSLFSPVGMLPAALMGLDIEALLKGAARMDRATRKRELEQNPAALLAGAWYAAVNQADLGEMVVLPYKDRLQLWTRYVQQLVMESLGKAKDLDGKEVHSGIVVYGNKGSFDQHVLLQYLCDGPVGPFVVFLHVLRDVCGAAWGSGGAWDVEEKVEPETTSGDCLLAQMLGTRHALKRKGRPSMTIGLQRLDPPSLGQLVALHERAVGLYASLIRVNAYNQPSLELGKEESRWVLESQKKVMAILREAQPEPLTSAQLARQAGFGDRVETVYKLLTHLAANVNRGVRRRKASSPDEEEFWWEKGTSKG
jgi:glucose-6-phosphate isomerase